MKSVTQYELLSLIHPDLPDAELNDLLARLRAVITEAGGEISTEELWGKRRLAYEVDKYREGVYNYTVFRGGAEIPRLLDEFANTEARLLRHLCTTIPKRKLLEDERRLRVEAERARREEEEAKKAAEARAAAQAAGIAAAEGEPGAEGAARISRDASGETGGSKTVEGKLAETPDQNAKQVFGASDLSVKQSGADEAEQAE